MPPPTLLLVDDDLRLREAAAALPGIAGFRGQGVGDGEQMQQALDRGHHDLIVLDLMLPGESGLDICRRLHRPGDATPVVMLTAKGRRRSTTSSGLEIGADDYLPNRSIPRELLARIRAILRRSAPPAPARRSPTAAKCASGRSRSTSAAAS